MLVAVHAAQKMKDWRGTAFHQIAERASWSRLQLFHVRTIAGVGVIDDAQGRCRPTWFARSVRGSRA